jgi:hypothetical protein
MPIMTRTGRMFYSVAWKFKQSQTRSNISQHSVQTRTTCCIQQCWTSMFALYVPLTPEYCNIACWLALNLLFQSTLFLYLFKVNKRIVTEDFWNWKDSRIIRPIEFTSARWVNVLVARYFTLVFHLNKLRKLLFLYPAPIIKNTWKIQTELRQELYFSGACISLNPQLLFLVQSVCDQRSKKLQ